MQDGEAAAGWEGPGPRVKDGSFCVVGLGCAVM
jgi:hypothetical protein